MEINKDNEIIFLYDDDELIWKVITLNFIKTDTGRSKCIIMPIAYNNINKSNDNVKMLGIQNGNFKYYDDENDSFNDIPNIDLLTDGFNQYKNFDTFIEYEKSITNVKTMKLWNYKTVKL